MNAGASLQRRLIYAAAFLRAAGVSLSAILLGVYLPHLNLTPGEMGTVVSVGLSGAVVAAIVTTYRGEAWGGKRMLLALSFLSAAGGIALAFSSSYWAACLASFFGMLNGAGRDRSASLIIDQSILPDLADERERTAVFARYNVAQDLGHAVGAVAAGIPALFRLFPSVSEVASLRMSMAVYGVLMALVLCLYAGLKVGKKTPHLSIGSISPESKTILWKISSLIFIDAFGGGFLTTTFISYFFHEKFHATEATIGLLFGLARVLNAVSHLGAAWLAKRIGLVHTMVFTHIPSSVFLMTVPYAPTFFIAALLFLLREGLVQMDVPTRQSYIVAVVKKEERVVVSGITHLVRLGGWALAPIVAGASMQGDSIGRPILIGGALKIAYDVLLYFSFRGIKPPEEANA